MKLKDFLPELSAKFTSLKNEHENELLNHIEAVKTENKYNNLSTRIAFDVFYASYSGSERISFYDRLGDDWNDATLRTVLVQALKQSGIYQML